MNLQLERAGVRLAAVLNEALEWPTYFGVTFRAEMLRDGRGKASSATVAKDTKANQNISNLLERHAQRQVKLAQAA